ncbi:hypothetical protein ER13_13350 [Brevundimonas sp. EAKA]|nr:hypothetical protein [Brevundimonas sp. EAKA]KDP94211.1 hypothetical protein ER13_13350 [Brevundimonas sp. EAKA]
MSSPRDPGGVEIGAALTQGLHPLAQGLQRREHAARGDQTAAHHQQGDDDAADQQAGHHMVHRGHEVGLGNADIQHADGLAGGVLDRVVGDEIGLAQDVGLTTIGFAGLQHRVIDGAGLEFGADSARTVVLDHIGRDPQVVHEDRRRAPHQGLDPIDRFDEVVHRRGADIQSAVPRRKPVAVVGQHVPGDAHIGLLAFGGAGLCIPGQQHHGHRQQDRGQGGQGADHHEGDLGRKGKRAGFHRRIQWRLRVFSQASLT